MAYFRMSVQPNNKVLLTDLHEHLLCTLCGGYLVDATTINRCLHSFCRACILHHLQVCARCPVCDVALNAESIHSNLRPDSTLQTLTYKLVPSLYENEMRRRQEFDVVDVRQKGSDEVVESVSRRRAYSGVRFIYTPSDLISVGLQHRERSTVKKLKSSRLHVVPKKANGSCRYLLCPAAVNMGLIKKFICLKFDLDDHKKVELYHCGECLRDGYTLIDIAYIFSWRKRGPILFEYLITESLQQRKAVKQTVQIKEGGKVQQTKSTRLSGSVSSAAAVVSSVVSGKTSSVAGSLAASDKSQSRKHSLTCTKSHPVESIVIPAQSSFDPDIACRGNASAENRTIRRQAAARGTCAKDMGQVGGSESLVVKDTSAPSESASNRSAVAVNNTAACVQSCAQVQESKEPAPEYSSVSATLIAGDLGWRITEAGLFYNIRQPDSLYALDPTLAELGAMQGGYQLGEPCNVGGAFLPREAPCQLGPPPSFSFYGAYPMCYGGSMFYPGFGLMGGGCHVGSQESFMREYQRVFGAGGVMCNPLPVMCPVDGAKSVEHAASVPDLSRTVGNGAEPSIVIDVNALKRTADKIGEIMAGVDRAGGCNNAEDSRVTDETRSEGQQLVDRSASALGKHDGMTGSGEKCSEEVKDVSKATDRGSVDTRTTHPKLDFGEIPKAIYQGCADTDLAQVVSPLEPEDERSRTVPPGVCTVLPSSLGVSRKRCNEMNLVFSDIPTGLTPPKASKNLSIAESIRESFWLEGCADFPADSPVEAFPESVETAGREGNAGDESDEGLEEGDILPPDDSVPASVECTTPYEDDDCTENECPRQTEAASEIKELDGFQLPAARKLSTCEMVELGLSGKDVSDERNGCSSGVSGTVGGLQLLGIFAQAPDGSITRIPARYVSTNCLPRSCQQTNGFLADYVVLPGATSEDGRMLRLGICQELSQKKEDGAEGNDHNWIEQGHVPSMERKEEEGTNKDRVLESTGNIASTEPSPKGTEASTTGTESPPLGTTAPAVTDLSEDLESLDGVEMARSCSDEVTCGVDEGYVLEYDEVCGDWQDQCNPDCSDQVDMNESGSYCDDRVHCSRKDINLPDSDVGVSLRNESDVAISGSKTRSCCKAGSCCQTINCDANSCDTLSCCNAREKGVLCSSDGEVTVSQKLPNTELQTNRTDDVRTSAVDVPGTGENCAHGMGTKMHSTSQQDGVVPDGVAPDDYRTGRKPNSSCDMKNLSYCRRVGASAKQLQRSSISSMPLLPPNRKLSSVLRRRKHGSNALFPRSLRLQLMSIRSRRTESDLLQRIMRRDLMVTSELSASDESDEKLEDLSAVCDRLLLGVTEKTMEQGSSSACQPSEATSSVNIGSEICVLGVKRPRMTQREPCVRLCRMSASTCGVNLRATGPCSRAKYRCGKGTRCNSAQQNIASHSLGNRCRSKAAAGVIKDPVVQSNKNCLNQPCAALTENHRHRLPDSQTNHITGDCGTSGTLDIALTNEVPGTTDDDLPVVVDSTVDSDDSALSSPEVPGEAIDSGLVVLASTACSSAILTVIETKLHRVMAAGRIDLSDSGVTGLFVP